jgi:uncharacterized membrane protein
MGRGLTAFGIFILIATIALVIFVFFIIRRNTDEISSHELLKRRYASGKITASEYEDIKIELGPELDCMELLNRRYAQGFITAEEYEIMKENLNITK